MSQHARVDPLEVFPFLVGCRGAGARPLGEMLAASAGLAVPPESRFLTPLAGQFGASWAGEEDVIARFADALASDPGFARWGIDRGELGDLLEAAAAVNAAEAWRALFAAWAERAGKTAYADATPTHVTRLGWLAELFPEARFVHVIRDGRRVALAATRAAGGAPQNAVQAALRWRTDVAAGREQGRELGPGRYLEISWEELAESREAVLGRVCEFLGLPFEPAPAAAIGGAAASSGREATAPEPGEDDLTAAMSRGELARFELLAGDQLAELGYPLYTGAGEAPEVERERLALATAEIERLRDRLEELAARGAEDEAGGTTEAEEAAGPTRRARLRSRLRRLLPGRSRGTE